MNMFTGIIEEIGRVKNIKQSAQAVELTIHANKIMKDMHNGDSISVNGVCLTVTSFSNDEFHLDVMPETIKSTSLRELKNGSTVNLERAMSPQGRFGGHFVSGHVDGVGTVKNIKDVGNARYYEIKADAEIIKYTILKGSVAIDGTSLTVFEVSDSTFTISLIPHTRAETILSEKGVGDLVNIECDMLGKYIEHFVHSRFSDSQEENKTSITYDLLQKNGFA